MILPLLGIDIRLIGKQRTGDEVVFLNLTRALLQTGKGSYQFRLYTDEGDDARLLEVRDLLHCNGRDDVEICSLPAGRNRFWWNLWVLPRELARRPIALYHTQYIAPLWLPNQIKLVTHIHDVSFAAHPEWIGTKDRFFLDWLIPRSIRRSQLIVVPSLFTQSETLAYYPESKGKVVVIPNAVAQEWLSPVEASAREAVREQFQLPSRYIIASGTMQPRKNIPLLIEAWSHRPAELAAVGLVLTGNRFGHHVDEQLQDAGRVQDIIFPGYVTVPTLKALVAGAELVVFPSRYEGFGIPMLEAFAVGTPVLAAKIPPFEEIAGENACRFFDPTSLAEMEKNLYTLLVEPEARNRLAQSGKEQLQRYSWEHSAVLLLSEYHKLLS